MCISLTNNYALKIELLVGKKVFSQFICAIFEGSVLITLK